MKNYSNENCVYVVHLLSQHGIGGGYFDRLYSYLGRRGSIARYIHAARYLSIGNDRAIFSQLATAYFKIKRRAVSWQQLVVGARAAIASFPLHIASFTILPQHNYELILTIPFLLHSQLFHMHDGARFSVVAEVDQKQA